MSDPPPTLMLIDGNSLTYRAFFALPTDMATASGQVTNAVFGFTSMLINLLRDHQPDGHRRRLRPARADVPPRAGRRPTRPTAAAAPDILRQQMGLVRQVVETLAHPDPRAGRASRPTTSSPRSPPRPATTADDVIIVTGDRDSYQLVEDPHVKVLYNRRGVSRLRALRRGRHRGAHRRARPRCTCQYAALRGDPSDNLPGVPGVGEKTAAKLINTYGGLDGIFAHVDEQTPEAAPEPGRARGPGPRRTPR